MTDALTRHAKTAYLARDGETLNALVEANPTHVGVLKEAARLGLDRKETAAALRCLGGALKHGGPSDWDVWHLMAAAQVQRGDHGEAEAAMDLALRLAPDMPLLWATYAAYAFHRGDTASGEARMAEVLRRPAHDPEDAHAQAEALMRLDQYGKAWPLWDARLAFRSIRGRAFPSVPMVELANERWTPNLTGKRVLVWGEQGFGDQMQFLRFVDPFRRRTGAHVLLHLNPALAPWAADLDGVELIADRDAVPYDLHLPLLSIPRILKEHNPRDFPAPYAPMGAKDVLPGRVGYCWRGNPDHGNDLDRSAPNREAFLAGLGATEAWVNLTGQDDDGPKGDWRETAALIASCERVVTVDTSIVHAAGSLGVPTILLAPSVPEWRWGRGATSRWYPSVRIIRKRYIGDWHGVYDRARHELDGGSIGG